MEAGAVLAERFEIERLAGTGGMARVYRARDRVTGSLVAVKILQDDDPQLTERFRREGALLARMTHPAIVRYVSDGTTAEGKPFLALEWLEGQTLESRLAAGGIPARDAVALACRVAEGLGSAHAQGWVHRDVKPSNLFLADGDLGRVKILDFGIAHVGRTATRAMTHTGALLGTPGYMAPEQARGERGVDARADVFSLGCVLFECLTGRAPFFGETFMAVLAKILLEHVPRLRDLEAGVQPALDDLVARMIAKDRDARPRDGRAVAAELSALGDVGSALPTTRAHAAPASLTIGEQRLLTLVLAGGDLALVTGGGTALVQTVEQSGGTLDGLRAEAARFGGQLERVLGGSLVATFPARGGAMDQVGQAVRFALAMRARLQGVPIAIATGRGVIASGWPVGDAIDRAVGILRDAPAGGGFVRVDDTTAGLLDPRFEVGGDERGLAVVRLREGEEVTRTLLGRVVPCFGRERELSQLDHLLEECIDEPAARAVLVTAPPGVGKSRLRYEFVRTIQHRTKKRVEVWIARGDPMSAGSAFGLVGQALRSSAGIRGGEPLEVRRRKLRARIARNLRGSEVGRVTEFLGEVASAETSAEGSPDSAPASRQLRAARDDARLMNDQIRRAFEDFVAAECAAQPVLLVLEDLHWGDLPTVQLVDAALRHASELPFFVLALGRPEILDQFPRIWDERGLVPLPLRELKRSSAEKLVREVLGPGAAPALVQRVVDLSAGNAFYLEELLRAVAEGKEASLPATVLAMVEARLESLEPSARQVLRAASIFGQVFWRRGVHALLRGADGTSTIDEWLAELVAREIVQPRRDGRFPSEQEYVFRHALVREGAYAMLTDDDKRTGHRLAGEWLRAAGETHPVLLAEHLERGGALGDAVVGWRQASFQALEGNDLRAAIAYAERGVRCGAADETLGELRLVQAEALGWLAEYDGVDLRAGEALACLREGTPQWFEAAGLVAQNAGRRSDVPLLGSVAERLRSAPVVPSSFTAFAAAAAKAVAALISRARFDLADTLIARLDALRAEIGDDDPVAVAWVLHARSWRRLIDGDLAACLELDTSTLSCFEAIGDLRRACEQLANVGYDRMNLGAYAQAEVALRGALGSADRMGLPAVAAMARHNLGLVLARQGGFEEAIEVERVALDAFVRQGDRRMSGAGHFYLTLILSDAGKLDAAASAGRAAVEAMRDSPPYLAPALAALARVCVAMGRGAEGLALATEAHDLLEALGGVGENEALVRLAFVEALQDQGEAERMERALAAARTFVTTCAAKIHDPGWRAAFVTHIPENARILELAAALS